MVSVCKICERLLFAARLVHLCLDDFAHDRRGIAARRKAEGEHQRIFTAGADLQIGGGNPVRPARSGKLAAAHGEGRRIDAGILDDRRLPGERVAASREERMAGQRSRRVDLRRFDPSRIRLRVVAHEKAPARPLAQHVSGKGPREKALLEAPGEAAIEQFRLQCRECELAQEPIANVRFAAQDGPAELRIVAALAEALRAEEVRRAARPKLRGDPLRARERAGNASPHGDLESVPSQVPGPELVPVARDGEDAKARTRERTGARHLLLGRNAGREGNAQRLHGDGAQVLEAGDAHVPLADREQARHVAHHVLRVPAHLLDAQVEMISAPARRVERDLLHTEVLGHRADHAAGAAQIGGEERYRPGREPALWGAQGGESERWPVSRSLKTDLVVSNSPSAVRAAISPSVRMPSERSTISRAPSTSTPFSSAFPVLRGLASGPGMRARNRSISSILRRPSRSSASVSIPAETGSIARSKPPKRRNSPLRTTSRARKISTTCTRKARGRSSRAKAPRSMRTSPMRPVLAAPACALSARASSSRSSMPWRVRISPKRPAGLLETPQETLPSSSTSARSTPSLRA